MHILKSYVVNQSWVGGGGRRGMVSLKTELHYTHFQADQVTLIVNK